MKSPNFIHSSSTKWFRLFSIWFLFVIQGTFLYKLFRAQTIDGALITGIIILAILSLLDLPAIDLSEYTFGKNRIHTNLNDLDKNVSRIKDDMNRLVSLMITPTSLQILKNIKDGIHSPVRIEDIESDLYRLHKIGFLEKIGEPMEGKNDLRRIYAITQIGQDFIEKD